MSRFNEVSLELVRPGPPHNQLLSPLTPYMALCGESSPITFSIDLEHRQLLNRLERMRYVMPGVRGTGPEEIPEQVRQSELVELGDAVEEILSRIQSLRSELSRARGKTDGDKDSFVHLRVVLSGSELSLIPYELAVAPQAFPGEGLEFFLQTGLPTVITREIRRSRAAPVSWDRSDGARVLFVYAAPEGMSVPARAHVAALLAAMKPWIGGMGVSDGTTERLDHIKERLRILPNASVDDIYEACAAHEFTHVHVLAHGARRDEAHEQQYGVALCQHRERQRSNVVTGKQLAKALLAENAQGSGRSRPGMVTLTICDSGNQGSVLIPGGSIAHDLHSAGIPWVIASQFPLTKRGSTRLIEDLFPRLLRGDDPRQALYEVRRRLHMLADRDHDWASLVAYAVAPEDFAEQVFAFFVRQTKLAIEVALERADASRQDGVGTQRSEALDPVREHLDRWRSRLPVGDEMADRMQRTECYGIHGSVFKRIALMHRKTLEEMLLRGVQETTQDAIREENLATEAYKTALEYYRKAMDQEATEGDKYHWTATQFLALAAARDHGRDAKTYERARHVAQAQLLKKQPPTDEAWAHGSLAELEMLALYHQIEQGKQPPQRFKSAIRKSVAEHCTRMVELVGIESFHVDSTRRQFNRYRSKDWNDAGWSDIVDAALEVFGSAAS